MTAIASVMITPPLIARALAGFLDIMKNANQAMMLSTTTIPTVHKMVFPVFAAFVFIYVVIFFMSEEAANMVLMPISAVIAKSIITAILATIPDTFVPPPLLSRAGLSLLYAASNDDSALSVSALRSGSSA